MVEDKKIDVMFFEAFEEEKQLLKKLCPSHVKVEFTDKTIQESGLKIAPSKCISIRTQSCIPESWTQDVDGILTRSTGYDHILEYFKKTKSSAQAGYLPSYCARAVAEQAVLLMMSLFRGLKKQEKHFQEFCRDGLTGFECQGKNVLIVGVGNIGSEIVDIAHGLRMKVAGVDIDQKIPSLEYTDLTAGLAWADVVVCALPLTEETKGMLGYEVLKKVKNGTIFINIARGEISPLADLKQLLDEGILGGAGLDTYEDEKNIAQYLRDPKNYQENENIKIIKEFSKKDNVVMTPHNAFNTHQALAKKAEQTMESVVMFLTEKKFLYSMPQE